jgi:hypothetical protein
LDKVKINLFGESWSLKELELNHELTSKCLSSAKKLNRDLPDLLLDLSFYEELGIPGIKSIADLPGTCIRGIQNTPKSQLEIWLNGKKILKIRLESLFNQNTLFRLYQTQEKVIYFEDLDQGIYLFEYEMGLVASYRFNIPKFTIDQLSFGLLKFQIEDLNVEVLTEVFFNTKLLVSTHSDTIITCSNCRKR